MPQAVTHILVPLILASIFRDIYLKKNPKGSFPLHYVLLAGLGGVLPDIDIPISVVLSLLGAQTWWIHRTFTHTIFFSLCFILIAALAIPFHNRLKICARKKHTIYLSIASLMIAFGIVTHLLLDGLVGENVYLFYPIWKYDFGINLLFGHSPKAWAPFIMPLIDGILLVVWIVYLEVKHKISDFI